jgi:Flp pilus assembly protein TadB
VRTKLLLTGIVALAILVVAFMSWSAQRARKKSHDILVEFQRTDRSIDSSARMLKHKNDSVPDMDSASQISN